MTELPKRTSIAARESAPENARAEATSDKPDVWAAPKAEDLVVAGDHQEITRQANAEYADLKQVRKQFAAEEDQAEVDELEQMLGNTTEHPQGARETEAGRQEMDALNASWNASAEKQQPKSRLRKLGAMVLSKLR